jgi:hypothetical protein
VFFKNFETLVNSAQGGESWQACQALCRQTDGCTGWIQRDDSHGNYPNTCIVLKLLGTEVFIDIHSGHTCGSVDAIDCGGKSTGLKMKCRIKLVTDV